MKKYVFLFCICLPAIHASAQGMEEMLPKTATYYIKGGPEIAYSKIDSVVASWGGRFEMEHAENKIYLSPTTAVDLKAIQDLKDKANLLLNMPAPAFTLTDVQGKPVSLADLKGKVVVLNFWFTTCAGCIAEMPELNKIKQAYAGKNVVFLALGRDNAEAAKAFLKKHEFNYNLLTDAIKTAADYQVAVYPTSMVIDQRGLIRFVQVTGEAIEKTLPAAINILL